MCARAVRRESSTMSGKYVFFEFYGSYWRAKENFIFEFSTSKRTKKALAFFHIFRIERAGAA